MPYDGNKEIEAYEYGLEQRKRGNGQELDLLIDATDYLDRTGESEYNILDVDDIHIGRSVGASAKNYPVKGKGWIVEDGENRYVLLHWYRSYGKDGYYSFKVKEYLEG